MLGVPGYREEVRERGERRRILAYARIWKNMPGTGSRIEDVCQAEGWACGSQRLCPSCPVPRALGTVEQLWTVTMELTKETLGSWPPAWTLELSSLRERLNLWQYLGFWKTSGW